MNQSIECRGVELIRKGGQAHPQKEGKPKPAKWWSLVSESDTFRGVLRSEIFIPSTTGYY